MTRIASARALVEGHRPADAREAAFAARMAALLDRGEAAFSRDEHAPGHFTASAFVLSPDRSRLLLILHGKLGLWLQPGGHVEPGDASLLDAARREVREETGLARLDSLGQGALDLDIHEIPARGGVPAHQHFDVRFLFAARKIDRVAADDARAARWVDFHDGGALAHGRVAGAAPEPADPLGDESVMRAVRRIRALFG